MSDEEVLEYLSKGSCSYFSATGGTAYRAQVRKLRSMAKETGVSVDITTIDHGDTMELTWRIHKSIRCVDCSYHILIGERLVEAYVFTDIPEDHIEGAGLKVKTRFVGYRHDRCPSE